MISLVYSASLLKFFPGLLEKRSDVILITFLAAVPLLDYAAIPLDPGFYCVCVFKHLVSSYAAANLI